MGNPSIREQIEEIMGFVADEAFEGWPEYWEDASRVSEAIMTLLAEWKEEADNKGKIAP